jgi:DNA phosphorothioation-dependent restriction protein DptG
MAIIYTEVEVDVDLYDFETNDLIEELERRDVVVGQENKDLILKIYESQSLGKDIQPLLNELYWNTLGRIA